MIKSKSYAKINLGLEVIGERDDGYNNINSVITKINLFDEITLEIANKNSINQDGILEKNNIIFRVINYMQNNYISKNLKISVKKNIPYSSGLGGGSSNAATVIKLIDNMFNLNLDSKEIFDIGLLFGSDVPFFLGPNTAFVTGRGERLLFIPKPKIDNILLIYPKMNLHNKTKTVFKNLSTFTNGNHQQELIRKIKNHEIIFSSQFNGLEEAAFNSFSELKEFKTKLMSLGLSNISMSGAGPTFYSILSKTETKIMKNKIENITNANCYDLGLL